MSTLGWVQSPDGRGTIDIIWSCLVTITLCCWSSLCVNAPARGEGQVRQLIDKINLACIGLIGPEWLFALSLGQYLSARRSVQDFHAAGHKSWTMRHAFFADMGGFALELPPLETPPSLPPAHHPGPMIFPLDAKQLLYLVENQYVDLPATEEEDIAESDRLARYITIVQVVWFSVNSIARAVQHLQITTLELTTLAFIPCMIISSFCWYYKPSSIGPSNIIPCKTTLASILIAAGDKAREPYRKTPLDFISREEWSISLLWTHDLNILRKLHVPLFARRMNCRPFNRIPNDNWPKLGFMGGTILGIACIVYSAIFISAWNYPFPTKAERILWRVSSLGTLGFSMLLSIVETVGFRIYMPHKQRPAQSHEPDQPAVNADLESSSNLSLSTSLRPYQVWYRSPRITRKAQKIAARWRNNSPDQDPALEIPLRVLIPLQFLCLAYSLFRMFFFVEDVLGLRSLPPSAFQTVAWPDWFPHI